VIHEERPSAELLSEESKRLGVEALVLSGALALSATVAGREALALEAYQAALDAKVPADALAEVAFMAHLFGGFPRAIQGALAFQEACRSRGAVPVGLGSSTTLLEDRARGIDLFRRIYSSNADAVLGSLRSCLSGFDQVVLEDAYGRILSRPGLSARARELMAVAALLVLRCHVQLMSHARGAIRCGASAAEVLGVSEWLLRFFVEADLLESTAALRRWLSRDGDDPL